MPLYVTEVLYLLPPEVIKTIRSQVLEDRKRGQGATMEERKAKHRLKTDYILYQNTTNMYIYQDNS